MRVLAHRLHGQKTRWKIPTYRQNFRVGMARLRLICQISLPVYSIDQKNPLAQTFPFHKEVFDRIQKKI